MAKTPQRILESNMRSYFKHRNARLSAAKQYAQEHTGEIKAYKQRWYSENKEHVLAARKERHRIHRETENANKRAYREANKEKLHEFCKSPAAKASVTHHRHLRRLRGSDTDITSGWLVELKAKAGNCPVCDVTMASDGRKMDGKTLDHIIPINVGGKHSMRNVRYICRNCNLSRPKDGSDIQ
jgi:5-methylcytosine-specific restriction endonuclease McrA